MKKNIIKIRGDNNAHLAVTKVDRCTEQNIKLN